MPGNWLTIGMDFQGLDKVQATAIWQPFLDWVAGQDDFTATEPTIFAGAGRYRWDGAMLQKYVPDAIRQDDDRAGAHELGKGVEREKRHVLADLTGLPGRQGEVAPHLPAALVIDPLHQVGALKIGGQSSDCTGSLCRPSMS